MRRQRHKLIIGLLCTSAGICWGCNDSDVTIAGDQYCESSCRISVCRIEDEGQRESALADCDEYCHDKIAEAVRQGSVCESAFLSGTECIGSLQCDEYFEWLMAMDSGPCPGERERVAEVCEDLYLEPYLGLPGP
jgi:hypothetical protein